MPSRTIIVAPNHHRAVDWCHRQEPPINPRSRSAMILTGRHDAYRLMGLRLEDWTVEIIGWPENTVDYQAVRDALRSRGWPAVGEGLLGSAELPMVGNSAPHWGGRGDV